MLVLSSCMTNDMVNEQDYHLMTKTQVQSTISKSSLDSTTNKSNVLMDLQIPSGMNSENGGCTFTDGNINGSFTSTAAYGPNPLTFNGYVIRGYGLPRRDTDWKGILFEAENLVKIINQRGQSREANDSKSNAISIEFPFSPNLTYEITLEAFIEDYIATTKLDIYNSNDNIFDIDQSEAYPTIAIELSDSPQIRGNNPCAKRAVVSNAFVNRKYYKEQKAQIIVPPLSQKKTFTFKFSTTEAKNAFIIYFLPELSGTNILKSSFSMYLTNIKIIEKPFEQSFEPTNPSNGDGGFR